MANFVDIDFSASEQALLDLVIARLKANGWNPETGDQEVVFAESISPAAAILWDAIGQVPGAVFRKFGTDLQNTPYQPGAKATAFVTVTADAVVTGTDLALPAGTQFELGVGFYFEAVDDIVIPVASSSVSGVELRALIEGADANGLGGAAQPVSQLGRINSVTVEGVSGGGADAEDDQGYEDRLRDALTLSAPRPITARDFAVFARSVPDVQVGRSTALDGYDPSVHTTTGNRTSGSAVISSVASMTGITVGTAVSGTGIPAGATVLSVGAGTFTMSANATSSGTGGTITATGSYGNERMVYVVVTAEDGTALDSTAKGVIDAFLQDHRELNFIVNVADANYDAITVVYSIKPYVGFDPTALIANVDAAIESFLSPLTWGVQGQLQGRSNAEWTNEPIIRFNKLIGVIEAVNGVDYVASLTINGTAVDHKMPGPAPLPTLTSSTGSAI